MSLLDACRNALGYANVQAFLRVIRSCEGTAGEDGYRRLFGGEMFDSFGSHPGRAITKLHGGKTITSTAAGAYQFLSGTWAECQDALALPNFSPPMQDLAAVFLIRRRGALDHVLAGRLEDAIARCAKEWASLPGSPYGQPVKTMAHCRVVYEQWGGKYAPVAFTELDQEPEPPLVQPGPEPVEPRMPDPPRPDQEPYTQPVPEPRKMAIPAIVAAVLPSIIEAIPKLGGLFGSGSKVSERNVKAAETVVEIVRSATGAVNAQDAAERLRNDPAAVAVATKAIEAAWFDLHQASEDSASAARQFATGYAQDHNVRVVLGNLTFLEVLSLLLVICTLGGGLAAIIWGGIDAQLKGAIVTLMLIGGYTAVTQFWFGSSLGSKKKDDRA